MYKCAIKKEERLVVDFSAGVVVWSGGRCCWVWWTGAECVEIEWWTRVIGKSAPKLRRLIHQPARRAEAKREDSWEWAWNANISEGSKQRAAELLVEARDEPKASQRTGRALSAAPKRKRKRKQTQRSARWGLKLSRRWILRDSLLNSCCRYQLNSLRPVSVAESLIRLYIAAISR